MTRARVSHISLNYTGFALSALESLWVLTQCAPTAVAAPGPPIRRRGDTLPWDWTHASHARPTTRWPRRGDDSDARCPRASAHGSPAPLAGRPLSRQLDCILSQPTRRPCARVDQPVGAQSLHLRGHAPPEPATWRGPALTAFPHTARDNQGARHPWVGASRRRAPCGVFRSRRRRTPEPGGSIAQPHKPTAPARHEVAGVGGHARWPGPLGSSLRRTCSGSPANALCSSNAPTPATDEIFADTTSW